MSRIIFCCAILGLFAIGCNTYPVTKADAVDSRPTLSFTGASEGAVLLVDGINMGAVSKYNGNPDVLRVLPGSHQITVMGSNKVIFQETIFVESENKVINIH